MSRVSCLHCLYCKLLQQVRKLEDKVSSLEAEVKISKAQHEAQLQQTVPLTKVISYHSSW